MDKKETRKRKLREWLISLLITLVLFAIVLGFQFWLTGTVRKGFTPDEPADFWRGNLIGDLIGGVILLLIVHHFVKKPKEENR